MKTPLTLIGRLQSGNCPESWDKFCSLYYPLVYVWCLQSTKNREWAEDMAQEVFLDIFRGLDGFDRKREGAFRSWLRRVMVSRLLKLRRARFPKMVAFDELAATRALMRTGAVDGLDYQGIFERACEAVRPHCTPQQWEIFDRTHLRDEPAEAVAAALGVTTNSIYIIRYRISRSLKKALLDQMG